MSKLTLSETRRFLDSVRVLLDRVEVEAVSRETGGLTTYGGPQSEELALLDVIRSELNAYETKWPQIVYSAEEVSRQLGERDNK